MIKKSVLKALNDNLNEEYFSSYTYLSISSYFAGLGLDGFKHWMELQAAEEFQHVMKFFNFILERNGAISLEGMNKPVHQFKSPLDAFQFVLTHEQKVTERIHKLMDLAIKESDHPTNNFLQWFIAEQVEEEATVEQIIQKLKLIGKDPTALFMLDAELAKRTLTVVDKTE